MPTAYHKPYIFRTKKPTSKDVNMARKGIKVIAAKRIDNSTLRLQTSGDDHFINLPRGAFDLIVTMLEVLSEGHPVVVAAADEVTVTPINDPEIGTQETADILNVSRPYVVKLMETGLIPYRKVGRHRRARMSEVLAYKAHVDAQSKRAREELVAQAQRLGHGY